MHPGDLISGKYRLQRPLGTGGMGSVWAARNELTDRDFAIKFLLPALAQNKEALQRFFREARACGQLKHPALVDVYDVGQADDGSPFLVMELLEGEGFDHRLARCGLLAPADAADWIALVARGLEEAHLRRLVHRDLKPGNIFLSLDARGELIPKILDFGVSKAAGVQDGGDFVKTTPGAVLGSPAYMSPEQAKGEVDLDGRSDVWSLGVILYEALTGQLPFDAPNYNALMVAIMMRPHQPVVSLAPTVPPELSAVVDRALAKERDQRIGTARQFAEELEAVLAIIAPERSPLHVAGTTQPGFGGARSVPTSTPPAGEPSAVGSALRHHASTQGPWSESGEPRIRPFRRSLQAWVAAPLLGACVVAAGGFAYARSRGPIAAVAGRSAAALTTGLSRLQSQLDRMQAEDERRAREVLQAPAPSAPSKTTPSRPRPTTPHHAPNGSTRPKPSSDDANGGVDSAGF